MRVRGAAAGALICALTLLVAGCGGNNASKSVGLAYVRGNATAPPYVWAANAAGGNPRKLGKGGAGLLSPDGTKIAVTPTASVGAAVTVYSQSGKVLHQFFDAQQDYAYPLAWSANSRYLVVSLAGGAAATGGLGVIDTKTMRGNVVAHGYVAGASFNPRGTQIVFGASASQAATAPVYLFTVSPEDADRSSNTDINQLTDDGASLNPLWLKAGIVFARQTLRGKKQVPEFQLWLRTGNHMKKLTNLKVGPQTDGLLPLAAADDGNRILAQLVGESTDNAWTVQLSPLRIKEVKVDGKPVQAAGISRDGNDLLVDRRGPNDPPDAGVIMTVPWAGGKGTILTHGASPTWNR